MSTRGIVSRDEVDELEAFLMEDRDGSEAMTFDMMDGYMHAVAIGPTTLKPRSKAERSMTPRAGPGLR